MPQSRIISVIQTTLDDGSIEYSLENGTPIGNKKIKKAESHLVTPPTPEQIKDRDAKKVANLIADPAAIIQKNKERVE